jgi:hypothetical protein
MVAAGAEVIGGKGPNRGQNGPFKSSLKFARVRPQHEDFPASRAGWP